jgi:hypothetical protein
MDIQKRKELLTRHNAVLLRAIQQFEAAKRAEQVLPIFRDAVVAELV